MGKPSQAAIELELPGGVSIEESCREFAAEDLAENPYWEKKAVTVRLNPLAVIRGQATGRHDTVDVRMMLKFLIPGVQDAQETDLGAEMLGVGRNLNQCFGAAAEQ